MDWIPEHLPESVKRDLLTLAQESEGIELVEPSAPLIRHWLEATEDGNPLYFDDEFARSQGFRGIVAPPGMNLSLVIPYRWPRPHSGLARNLHYALKRVMNTPTGVVVEIDTEHVRPIEVGDRLFLSNRLASITGPKQTRMGEGYFWVMESIIRDDRGDVVVRDRITMFAYDSGIPPEDDEAFTPDGLSRATEDALDPDRRTTHPPTGQHVVWDDVQEGAVLPTLVMPITVTRCVYLASATRDFSPHHSNRDYAQQEIGARDMFTNTPFNAGMLSRFVTDWAGPSSLVRRMKLQMRENICAGDDMIINGRVVRKYVDDNEHLVDIDIQVSTQHGPAYGASATLRLPLV